MTTPSLDPPVAVRGKSISWLKRKSRGDARAHSSDDNDPTNIDHRYCCDDNDKSSSAEGTGVQFRNTHFVPS